MATDILVETGDPAELDRIVQSIGAAVVGGGESGGYVRREGCFVVRCFGDPGFIEFAINSQGYGKVLRRLESLV